MINNPLGTEVFWSDCQQCAISGCQSMTFSSSPAAAAAQKRKLCVMWDWAMPAPSPLPTLQFTAGLHLSRAGSASWQPQREPHHQHCPALGSTSVNWVQLRAGFILILTNQLIRVQNNILRLGKSFWLWKILKFILVFLAQTTWRLSAKLYKTN